MLFIALEGLGIASYALLTSLDWSLIYALVIVEHIAGGMATVALFTVMMDRCRESSAGSDYALQSCLVVLSTLLATSLAGFSAASFGYAVHYLIAAVLCMIGFIVLIINRENIGSRKICQI